MLMPDPNRNPDPGKLLMFLMNRDEWWRMHVIESWRTFTRHERSVRRFLVRWMFQGMAKTFIAWQRHVRETIRERNSGLARGMAMLSGGTQYKCFQAWAWAAREQIAERETVLRAQLLTKGNVLGVRVVRAWFDWKAERTVRKG